MLAATLGTALLTMAMAIAPPQESRSPQVPDLKVDTYTLDNGLEVILHEDHTVPVVAVNLWYKVGSKDEAEGRTGFAHLFEHLMFQGSEHLDGEYFAPLQRIGAELNGSTSSDRTNYYETVPSNALELALWLESDRMGFLLPSLSQGKLDNQRDVVKNERRQRVDNVPYGQAQERLLAALYPTEHPYHHPTIGSMADLTAATLGDVKNFFRRYYAPNNASLCLAGDFEPAEARRLIETYFGPIPRGPDVEPLEPRVPTLKAPVDLTISDRVSLPRLTLAWPTVPVGHPDEEALDVLAAVLGQLDKESRLERSMIYDQSLASQVFAFHRGEQLSGTFLVVATGRPDGPTLDELNARIILEIDRLRDEGPTADEVLKAQNIDESGLIFSLESMTRRANFFNANNVEYGDPLAYKEQMQALFAVTPEDVQRVARKYLTANRVRLDVTPGTPTPRPEELAVEPDVPIEIVPERPAVADTIDRSEMPEVGPAPEFAPPPVTRRTLDNGLEVLVVERPELPILTMRLVVFGGASRTPADRAGVAGLTADLLTEGTTNRTAQELAGELSRLGANLNASADMEALTLSLSTLTKHTDAALGLFADVVLRPAFAEADLVRRRELLLASLLRQRDDAAAVARIVYPKLLYGADHPYGRPVDGVPETVQAITRDDVVTYHSLLFRPNNAALIVVGDTTADAIVGQLETAALGDWEAADVPPFTLPEPSTVPAGPLYLVDRPGSAQSFIGMAEVGVPRSTEDYFPIVLMNAILGGQFTSRINLNLREDKGYTYGARSSFDFRRGPGPFLASAAVQTAVTAPALIELQKELVGVAAGDRPITETELSDARSDLVLGFPGTFSTTRGVSSTLENLVLYDLPDDYYTTYQDRLQGVTLDQVNAAASAHLHPDRMLKIVVGDRSAVESSLKDLPFVPEIAPLTVEGDPAGASETAGGE